MLNLDLTTGEILLPGQTSEETQLQKNLNKINDVLLPGQRPGQTFAETKLPVFLRTAYNYDMDEASYASGLHCQDPTLAQQNARDETDINVIMEKFGRGQQMPENYRPPVYADFTGVTDYHSAMNAVAEANEAFDALPAKVRARFHNDPQQLMAFLDNDQNRSEAEKLGIVPPPPQPPVQNVATAPLDPAPGPSPSDPPK